MIFEKGRHTNFDFYINNTKLETVTSFKYLGIHFFKNGSWHRTQKRLSQHAAFALHNLFSLFRQFECSATQKCKLFDVLVGSVLNYSAEVWGNNFFIYLFIQYFKRVTHLAVIAILPCGPLCKHIYIYTNTIVI